MLFKLVVGKISDAQLGYSRENGSLELLCNLITAIVGGDQKQGLAAPTCVPSARSSMRTIPDPDRCA